MVKLLQVVQPEPLCITLWEWSLMISAEAGANEDQCVQNSSVQLLAQHVQLATGEILIEVSRMDVQRPKHTDFLITAMLHILKRSVYMCTFKKYIYSAVCACRGAI